MQGRNTAQGLLGLRLLPSAAVLAELNCETDFVAKNRKFVRSVQRLILLFVYLLPLMEFFEESSYEQQLNKEN
jgi:translation elongation factor EF-Ts